MEKYYNNYMKYYVKVNGKVYLVNDLNLARLSANYYAYEDSEFENSEIEYGEVVEDELCSIEKFEVDRYGD